MMQKLLFLGCALFFSNIWALDQRIEDNGKNVVWTAVFENITPRNSTVSLEYCQKHIPTVITTNINQITSKNGIKATNGVSIKYLSYKGKNIDGLHFNTVKGMVFGSVDGKLWQEPISLYEQTLADVGKTWTVWSTPSCKGTFTGYPTIINSN